MEAEILDKNDPEWIEGVRKLKDAWLLDVRSSEEFAIHLGRISESLKK